jgi:hypothetical protein
MALVMKHGMSNNNIKKTLQLSRDMIILGDQGLASAQDDGCRLLYGVVQDCAYKIRMEAERERARHQFVGIWETEDKKL